MLLDVVIAVCAAFAAVGILMGLFKLLRSRPPRWLMPAVAAVAVIGVTATLRYQWAGNTEALLPGTMVTVERLTQSTPLEPWSLVRPVTTGLIVADTGSIRRNPAHPDMVLVDVLMVRREMPTLVAKHLVDCAGRRDAVVPTDATYGEDGLPEGLSWATDVPPGLFSAVCPAPVAG